MKLINDDMLVGINEIDDLSVDLLLTDPPYNISDRGANPSWIKDGVEVNSIHNQKFDEAFEHDWDSVDNEDFKDQIKAWAKAWFPKLRKGATFCIFISDVYISHLWEAMEEAGFEPKRIFTWKKPAAVPFNRKVNPVSGCEYILFGIKPKGKRTFNADAVKGSIVERYSLADKVSSIVYRHVKNSIDGNLEAAMKAALDEAKEMQERLKKTGDIVHCVIPNTITYSGGSTKDRIHPTQKPQEVLDYFVELCSNPGDLVLDTFAGSGSTGMAAKAAGRDFILIERDPKMFASMSARFDNPANTLFN